MSYCKAQWAWILVWGHMVYDLWRVRAKHIRKGSALEGTWSNMFALVQQDATKKTVVHFPIQSEGSISLPMLSRHWGSLVHIGRAHRLRGRWRVSVTRLKSPEPIHWPSLHCWFFSYWPILQIPTSLFSLKACSIICHQLGEPPKFTAFLLYCMKNISPCSWWLVPATEIARPPMLRTLHLTKIWMAWPKTPTTLDPHSRS